MFTISIGREKSRYIVERCLSQFYGYGHSNIFKNNRHLSITSYTNRGDWSRDPEIVAISICDTNSHIELWIDKNPTLISLFKECKDENEFKELFEKTVMANFSFSTIQKYHHVIEKDCIIRGRNQMRTDIRELLEGHD